MSLLDDNIDGQFEKSFAFLKHKWAKRDIMCRLFGYQVTDERLPIPQRCNQPYVFWTPASGYYDKEYEDNASYVWVGTREDGFIVISRKQFQEFLTLFSNESP